MDTHNNTLASSLIRVEAAIELRLLIERDASAMYRLIESNRAYLRKWLPWLDSTQSVEDERALISGAYTQYQNGQSCTYAIWYEGQIAGTIGYNQLDWVNRRTEIGYWLAVQHEGKGIMTRCCRALIKQAFDELELNKVEIRCATMNIRSCAIPQRLGFTQEGIARQGQWFYDHFVDLKLYGLLRDEWRQSSR